MDIKVNNIAQVTQVPDTVTTETGDGTFKFTLASAITDADLQAKVDLLMNDITAQGNRIAQHMDIRDMKKIVHKLEKSGFSANEIDKITHLNFERVVKNGVG